MGIDEYKKFRFGQIVGLVKYCLALVVICFLVINAPGQSRELVGYAGMFILGGSGLSKKLGL